MCRMLSSGLDDASVSQPRPGEQQTAATMWMCPGFTRPGLWTSTTQPASVRAMPELGIEENSIAKTECMLVVFLGCMRCCDNMLAGAVMASSWPDGRRNLSMQPVISIRSPPLRVSCHSQCQTLLSSLNLKCCVMHHDLHEMASDLDWSSLQGFNPIYTGFCDALSIDQLQPSPREIYEPGSIRLILPGGSC